MLRILLIEDEPEKRRLIAQTALEVPGIDLEAIHYVDNVKAAKRELKAAYYDLVILDINLPERPDLQARTGAGLDILKFIKHNDSAISPGYVVGMTAYDDGAASAEQDFSSPLWKLVRFSFSHPTWQEPLRQALAYLVEKHKPPYVNDGRTFHVDLAVFAALDEELDSVLALDANWRQVPVAHDHAQYFRGEFKKENSTLTVVAGTAPKMGMPSAAVAASKLISTFRPRIIAVVGICAGVRGKVDLGDILIADPCFDWGGGKWVNEKENNELCFQPAAYQWRLDENLRSGVRAVAAVPGLLDGIRRMYEFNKPPASPKVVVEAMASGASVLQANQLMTDVRDQHKNLVGIEMESYAVFTAAEYAAEPRPLCISMKSVCDFGDETKSDSSHHYAAHTSARFLFEFATRYLLPQYDGNR